MSNRNFILLAIILMIVLVAFFGFLFLRRGAPTTTGEDPGGSNFFSQWNPFNTGTPDNPGQPDAPVDIGGETPPEVEKPVLVKVSSVPVAGYAVFLKERYKEEAPVPADGETPEEEPRGEATPPQTELIPTLRYVDRVTGNIFQTFADEIDERRFTVTEIPKVHEAFFGNDGLSVVMRYLKSDGRTIETILASLPKEVLGGDITGDIEVRSTLLPANITDTSVSSDGRNLLYLFDSGEITVGTTLEFATGKKVQVFDSPFNEWLSQWPESGTVTLTTKPSYLTNGFLFKLDTRTRNFAQALSGVSGLTTLTGPDGKTVLYGDNTLALKLYNTETKTDVSLGLRTLPEKCVWNKDGTTIYCMAPKLVVGTNYPDAWYQGEVSFDDQLWTVNAETGEASILLDPGSIGSGENVDGIKLALDGGENYLFFVNKKDSYLWEARLR